MPKKQKNVILSYLRAFGRKAKPIWIKCVNAIKTYVPPLCKKIWNGFLSAKTFWSAFAILIILLIISIVVLSIRLHGFAKTDERAISLKSSMDETMNVFAMEYKNETGEITIQGRDGDKVIAPGAEVEYTLRLRNTDTVALNYSFVPDLGFTSPYKLPIVVRLLDPEDNYIIGDETTWIPLDEIEAKVCEGTLMQGESAEFLFQWKWPFESGDDAFDTHLGTIEFDGTIGVELDFGLRAETNTTIMANGGFTKTPVWNVIVILVIFLLLVAVVVLLIIHNLQAAKNGTSNFGHGGEKAIVATDSTIGSTGEHIPDHIAVGSPSTAKPPLYTPVGTHSPSPVIAVRRAVSGSTARINIEDFEHLFYSGDLVNLTTLKQRGIIPKDAAQVKILSKTSSRLNKALIVETQKISQNAREIICRAGGKVTLVAPDTGDEHH